MMTVSAPDKLQTPAMIRMGGRIGAIREGDEMLENGTGQRFEGSTEDFFRELEHIQIYLESKGGN